MDPEDAGDFGTGAPRSEHRETRGFLVRHELGNTHRIQAMIDTSPGDHPDEVIRRLAPIGHKHINMRGILSFDLGRHRSSSLLRQTPSATVERVPG